MWPGIRILLQIGGDETVANRDAGRFGRARERQQQGDLIRECGRRDQLSLSRRQHAVGGRVLRVALTPTRERRTGVHRIAREFLGDRPQLEPTRNDRVGLQRYLQ
jgi:hypothetical protein